MAGRAASADLPEWRDSHAYEWLRSADPQALAWEWLRRNPEYRREAAAAQPAASEGIRTVAEQPAACRWGLHAFEDARLSREARPLWLAAIDRSVLLATAIPSEEDADCFSLASFQSLAVAGLSGDDCRILLSDGKLNIRLDVRGLAILHGPVRLHYHISGFDAARRPIRTWERLRSLVKSGKLLPRSRWDANAPVRQVLLLRTLDALASGANQRDIATELIRAEAANAGWRAADPSLRSQVQRLVRGARAYARGGFWALLG